MTDFIMQNLNILAVALVSPFLYKLFWAIKIQIDNKRKGKPTFVVGATVDSLVFPSGYVFEHHDYLVEVIDVGFWSVTFLAGKATIKVPKSLLCSGKVMTIGYVPKL